MKVSSDRRGFSLLELMVVVSIVGLVIGVVVACFSGGIRVWESARILTHVEQEMYFGVENVRRDIEKEIPGAEFTKEAEVSIESGAFTTVGRILGRVADNDDLYEAARYVQELRRIKVGVYSVNRLPSDDHINLFELDRFEEGGWEPATFIEDDNEAIWVLYREWYDEIRDMFVLVLNDDELVIVRIEGALDHLLEKVIEDDDFLAGVFGQTRQWDRPPGSTY